MIRLYVIAVSCGVVAMAAVYQSIKQTGRVEGQRAEQVRVEKAEKKTDDRIKKAQRAAAARPAASVLDRWSTD